MDCKVITLAPEQKRGRDTVIVRVQDLLAKKGNNAQDTLIVVDSGPYSPTVTARLFEMAQALKAYRDAPRERKKPFRRNALLCLKNFMDVLKPVIKKVVEKPIRDKVLILDGIDTDQTFTVIYKHAHDLPEDLQKLIDQQEEDVEDVAPLESPKEKEMTTLLDELKKRQHRLEDPSLELVRQAEMKDLRSKAYSLAKELYGEDTFEGFDETEFSCVKATPD